MMVQRKKSIEVKKAYLDDNLFILLIILILS